MPKSQKPNRAFNFAADQAWAILEESFDSILAIAGRENEIDIEAVEKKLGRPLQNTQDVTNRDGVAVIPVMGPIFRYANIFTQISGGASVEILARDFNTALEDPAIKAILLNIDSPGGMVSGISEFSNHIADARGKKPIVAYISDTGASAAYWIASAADEIVVSDTAKVGSIGAVISYKKGEDQNYGKIISSQSPFKQADPNNAEGRSKVQATIDSLADVFINTVAKNRGVSREIVLNDFGQGGLFVGAEAVSAGLADSVGSYEATISALTSNANPMGQFGKNLKNGTQKSLHLSEKGEMNMSTEPATTEQSTMPVITAEYVKEKLPAVAQALQAEGATAERNRIQAIEAKGTLIPGHEALVAEMKFDGKTTPEQAADRILAAEGKVRIDTFAGIKRDAPAPLQQPPAETIAASVPSDPSIFDEQAVKAKWEQDASIRAEFRTFEVYKGFCKASSEGLVKLKRS